MAQKGHPRPGLGRRYCDRFIHTPEGIQKMPQALIVIFLLFFAVLAFAWFYWQRAKARDAVNTAAESPAETAAPVEQTDPAQ